ncbi:GET complex subunit get1 [Ophidiomyces ophidiicola]|nr:GET complex subunit get1 [Ophidiomyces ophidiicola]KAI1958596.1 GET complex subunit get1 [Ophidiomyces ophidiicola]
MASLLLVVLAIHIVTYLINTIGASTIDSLLWLIYLKLPNQTSQTAKEQMRLKTEVVQLKREMHATSSQDEFAKWAKLRRRYDKSMEEYETKSMIIPSPSALLEVVVRILIISLEIIDKALAQQKSSFDMAVKSVRFVGTTGVKFFLQFWYSKSPIFELPHGWIPWQVEWVLSFPRAPLGTVSIQVWSGVCATVVSLVGDAVGVMVVYITAKSPNKTTEAPRREKVAQPMEAKKEL